MINYNFEGVKIMMMSIITNAIQEHRRNKRAIKRLDKKIYLSVDLDDTIDLMQKRAELKGENKAIERFILNKESLPYSYIDTDVGYIIRLFREELSDDRK